MKINLDIKNKKGNFEADIEKLVEKGMEQTDKTWKDKFNIKHNAKKEMLEIKHKQKMEIEEKRQAKKSWMQKLEEERRKTKQLKLEEERRQEEEYRKDTKKKARISVVLGIIASVLMIIGSVLGTSNSGWYMMIFVGACTLYVIPFLWLDRIRRKRKKKKNKV